MANLPTTSTKNAVRIHDVSFHEDVIVVDVETTGKDPKTHKIVQIAMTKMNAHGNVQHLNKYFNPCISRDKQLEAYKIHKISPDFLLTQQPFRSSAQELVDFIGECKYLAGHNIMFDWNFLFIEYGRLKGDWITGLLSKNLTLIDTYKTSIKAYPSIRRYRLHDVAKHLGLTVHKQPKVKYRLSSPTKTETIKIDGKLQYDFHDAMCDVMATKEVLSDSLEKILNNDPSAKLSLQHVTIAHKYLVYDPKELIMIDKCITGEIPPTELKKIACNFMSTLNSSRGKLLSCVNKITLLQDAEFLKSSDDINDQRGWVLREAILAEEEQSQSESDLLKRKTESDMITFHFSQKKFRR